MWHDTKGSLKNANKESCFVTISIHSWELNIWNIFLENMNELLHLGMVFHHVEDGSDNYIPWMKDWLEKIVMHTNVCNKRSHKWISHSSPNISSFIISYIVAQRSPILLCTYPIQYLSHVFKFSTNLIIHHMSNASRFCSMKSPWT
jgi:hypothetical protein